MSTNVVYLFPATVQLADMNLTSVFGPYNSGLNRNYYAHATRLTRACDCERSVSGDKTQSRVLAWNGFIRTYFCNPRSLLRSRYVTSRSALRSRSVVFADFSC